MQTPDTTSYLSRRDVVYLGNLETKKSKVGVVSCHVMHIDTAVERTKGSRGRVLQSS